MKHLIQESQTQISQLTENIEKTKELFEAVVYEWTVISKTPLTIELLQSFFDQEKPNPGKIDLFLKREIAIMANLVSPYFDEMAVLAMMKAPDISGLIEKLNRLTTVQGPNFQYKIFWDAFNIEGNEITILEKQVEHLKESFRDYATTADEAERLVMVHAVIEAMNKIGTKYNILPELFFIHGLISVVGGKLVPASQFVHTGTFSRGA